MARPSMAALISRLRRMIADPAGGSQVWDDDSLQDVLDNHRREARYARLREIETIISGGTVQYLNYAADIGDWEDSVILTDASFNILTSGITPDLRTGRWTFSTMPNRPVHIVGFYYDLAGAAVEILEAWLAKEKLTFDFSADQQSFKRSQKFEQISQMIEKYRQEMWASTGAIIQNDFNASPY